MLEEDKLKAARLRAWVNMTRIALRYPLSVKMRRYNYWSRRFTKLVDQLAKYNK